MGLLIDGVISNWMFRCCRRK